MSSITLGTPERIPSRKRGFTDLERPFVEAEEQITGKLVLPFLSDFDPIGVTVRFDSEDLLDSFYGTNSYLEAHRTVVYDDLAVNAINRALEMRFVGMEN